MSNDKNFKMTLLMPLFRSCTTLRALCQLHAHLCVTGHHRDPLSSTKLLESYAKLGSLESAQLVFGNFPNPDPFMWGVLIKSYVWHFLFEPAISIYHEMLSKQFNISSFIFPSILKACSGVGDVSTGQKVHGRLIKSGFESDGVVETALLSMYGESGSLDIARTLFDEMPTKDVVSWSCMISHYVRHGQAHGALDMFREMVSEGIEVDCVTMLSVTDASAELAVHRIAKSVHGYIVRKGIESNRSDEALEIAIIIMYGKCDDLDSAETLFKRTISTSAASWNALISCYNHRARFQEALEIYRDMQEKEVKPNSVNIVNVLFSCSRLGLLREGKSVHCFIIRRDDIDPDLEFVGPALIDMYSNCGKLEDSQKVFDAIQDRKIVLWNSLIAVYNRNGLSEEALGFFVKLHAHGLLPDSFTLASSLSACGDICASLLGRQIHGFSVKTCLDFNEFVQNSLIDMYSKCGLIDSAHKMFNTIKQKSLVAWNSMVNGFAQNGKSIEAIRLLDQMHSRGLQMDKVSFLCAIQACSHLGYLEKAKWFHHKLIIYGVDMDSQVLSSLTDMYAKCGDLKMAETVFENNSAPTVVSWSSMISGYGIHGYLGSAISLFSHMIACGVKPNEVTFLGILSACSHAGSVKEGKFYYNLMIRDFDIKPQLGHYVCMVDLLSRSGDLEDAYRFIKTVPAPASASIWGALLNGCRIHRRMDMMEKIHKHILELEPDNSGYYILLSNIYAEGGKREGFGKMRSMMKNLGVKKVPGYSTIEISKRIYRFNAGDELHSQTEEIYRLLDHLKRLGQEQGYVMDQRDCCTTGIEEGYKANNVDRHSERLAIAFGIINTSPGTILRIFKNLRVCMDCHVFTKFVSKITNRDIIMRDLNRFHHFKNGNCSCKDYW